MQKQLRSRTVSYKEMIKHSIKMSDVNRSCQEYWKDLGIDFNNLLEHFEIFAVQEQPVSLHIKNGQYSLTTRFFWLSITACMKCSKVPSCYHTIQEIYLQEISAGEMLHMNILSFLVPFHKIVRAYLFLTISSFPMEQVRIVLYTKYV